MPRIAQSATEPLTLALLVALPLTVDFGAVGSPAMVGAAKLVCGRQPESDADLSSQPTLSRFEHGFSAQDCLRLAEASAPSRLP